LPEAATEIRNSARSARSLADALRADHRHDAVRGEEHGQREHRAEHDARSQCTPLTEAFERRRQSGDRIGDELLERLPGVGRGALDVNSGHETSRG